MSSSAKRSTSHSSEHGSMSAYVTGFILSLVFTFIPYYLVEKQTVAGTSLLFTILGFAVLQMLVQVIFFLHLGRGPKPNWNLYFFVATIGIVLVTVGGSIMIINNLHYNMSANDQTKKLVNDEAIYQIGGEKTGACQGVQTNHKVTIKNGVVSPLHTSANLCDTLTFINQDVQARDMSFGEHPNHTAYAGIEELIVRKGINKTFTLSETGTFKFHDHLQEETAGDFTVYK